MTPTARILVVDDERSIREFLTIMLQGDGHDVTAVPDGETGIASLEREPFDLVITDLKMSGQSGMEVLTAAKRDDP
ncbi:MAG: response regulator, partial [Myxococcales bacterium]|nr:response regulator [Myxococcales bacterium]